MKRLLFLLLLPILFSCNKSNLSDKFKEVLELPYIITSGVINEINIENYNSLEPEDLKTLYLHVKKDYDYYGSMIKGIIAVDSLKKKGVDESEIRSNYWDVFDNSLYALHKCKLNSGITAYSWYIYTSDGNQGTGHLFVTLFKEKDPYFCFELPVTNYYSDYPVWTSTEASAKIMEDGKVIIESNVENGEYDENNNESVSNIRTYEELQITKEGVEEIYSEQTDIIDEEEEEVEETVNPNYDDFDAITIGDGLKLRSEPSSDAEIITQYNTGELVRIIDESNTREVLTEGGMCDTYGFYWYKIKDVKGKEGWVYGKYIYKIRTPENKENVYSSIYNLGDEQYTFDYGYDLSYGPDDENGLTGCDMFYMPYLYKEGSKVMPIYYDKEKFPSDDLGWKSEQYDGGLIYLVLSSEGGSDHIVEVNESIWNSSPALELIISHGYQDGAAKSSVLISNITGKFEVVDYEFERDQY
ncbi:MAG: SH3 domain-containing protein [Bacteroidales bacterium]|nr:SH3 domain-containing protein [Bacteroidales bacterium]